MEKTKTFKKGILLALACTIFAFVALLMTGCGNIETKEDLTKVHSANITSWYEYEQESYLDTSININFDDVNIEEVVKITFELYQDDTLLGNAVSEKENLVTLLKDCAQYWDESEDTYKEVKGDRVLSCAFKTRTAEEDNGFWVRSACTATNEEVPNKLIVKVQVANIEYTSTFANA